MTALLINQLSLCLAAGTAVAESWLDKPLVIGKLEMPQAYWDLTRVVRQASRQGAAHEASQRHLVGYRLRTR